MKTRPSARTRAAVAAPRKRILIVDDHAIMRDGLSRMIAQEPDMEVCAQTGDAFAALELAAREKPDLALVDITISGKNGLELIKDLHVQYPRVAILALSMHEETLYAERVLRAGGRGYVMKTESGERMIKAMRQVLAGGIAISPTVSGKMLNRVIGHSSDISPIVEELTDRELEIFQIIGEGWDNAHIASHLHISSKTVEVHRGHIKEKLNIATTGELISFAARWNQAQGKI